MLVYERIENLDEFMKTLETISKDMQMFVKVKRELKEGNVYTGKIVLQYLSNGILCEYSKDIVSVQLLPDSFFYSLKLYASEELLNIVAVSYESKVADFNKQLEAEYMKAVSVFKGLGFMNIINSMLTEG